MREAKRERHATGERPRVESGLGLPPVESYSLFSRKT